MLNIRTSETDPLQIATITFPWLPGRIGLTFCPGKKGESTFGGPWQRDLETDLAVIRDWGASCLVTLMEEHELSLLQVEELPEAARRHGLHWLHLPIRDLDVPGESWLKDWRQENGPELRDRLVDGERILIHCRGGLGRTGLVGALLLRDLGLEADEAIRLVRRVRPNAIETREQEQFVRSYRSWAGRQSYRHFLGCLLGGALGDALGWPIEFTPLDGIRKKYGPQGITGPKPNAKGIVEVTDDTQMSLFTAEGILLAYQRFRDRGTGPLFDVITWEAYQRWLQTQSRQRPRNPEKVMAPGWLLREPALYARRAPGEACTSALEAGIQGTMHRPVNDSKGCGTVMRIAPSGLFVCSPSACRSLGKRAVNQEAFRLGCELSALTHGHPSGYLAGGFLALLIGRLIMGDSLEEAITTAREELIKHQGHEEVAEAIDRAFKVYAETRDNPSAQAVEQIGEGWVAEEALAIAIYCCLCHPDSFEKAVLLAVNHSGDSDSTGAITGNIMGALLGIDGIPDAWLENLELADTIRDMARRLFCCDAETPGVPAV